MSPNGGPTGERRVPQLAIAEALGEMRRWHEEISHVAIQAADTKLEAIRAQTKRIGHWVIGVLLILGIPTLAILTVLIREERVGSRAARDAARVAATLDDCLIPKGKCYEQQRAAGQQGGDRIMDFNGCLLLIEPPDRQESDIDKCRAYANKRYVERQKAGR